MDLHYNILQPKKNVKNPPLLVMLHGYGSNENDLFSFSEELNERFLIVSARAPISLPWGGYAWYNINFTETAGRFGNPDEARKAMQQVDELISSIQEKYNTQKNKTVLLGFSQGGILSYGLALNNPEKYAGFLALSAYVFREIMPTTINQEHVKQLAVFTSHGTEDPVIPIDWARKADAYLTENHVPHIYKEYSMAHGINPACFADMLAFITAHFAKL